MTKIIKACRLERLFSRGDSFVLLILSILNERETVKMIELRGKVICLGFLISSVIFSLAGCSKETTKPAEINKSTQTSADSKIKLFNGTGAVTKINLELVSVELDHEAIENLMPAMTMEFYVKEKSELEVLKIGDKVEFVLEDNAGQEKITSIKKIK